MHWFSDTYKKQMYGGLHFVVFVIRFPFTYRKMQFIFFLFVSELTFLQSDKEQGTNVRNPQVNIDHSRGNLENGCHDNYSTAPE